LGSIPPLQLEIQEFQVPKMQVLRVGFPVPDMFGDSP